MKKYLLLILLALTIEVSKAQLNNDYYQVYEGNGKGIRFWGSGDAYKIHMGSATEYFYGDVTSYSIKMNMSNHSGRGWTWGVGGLTPIASLTNLGRFQIASDFISLGRLGIGTPAPASKAHFVFNHNSTSMGTTASYFVLSNENTTANNYSGIAFSSNAAGLGTSLIRAQHNRDGANSGRLVFYTRNSDGGFFPGLAINEDNKVGIGTTEPDQKLTLEAANNTFINIKTNSKELLIGADHNGGIISTMTNDDLYLRTGGNVNRMVIKADGKVGIGTIIPGDDLLAVNGTIKAIEVKVSIDGWSDFVFEESYNLPTLEDVENHIKEKGHLKDIPSAKDVQENGLNLGEMDAKLLQKIEELTLYVIKQGKQIESLQKQIEEIQQ